MLKNCCKITKIYLQKQKAVFCVRQDLYDENHQAKFTNKIVELS